jgi:hypothetical protein
MVDNQMNPMTMDQVHMTFNSKKSRNTRPSFLISAATPGLTHFRIKPGMTAVNSGTNVLANNLQKNGALIPQSRC